MIKFVCRKCGHTVRTHKCAVWVYCPHNCTHFILKRVDEDDSRDDMGGGRVSGVSMRSQNRNKEERREV